MSFRAQRRTGFAEFRIRPFEILRRFAPQNDRPRNRVAHEFAICLVFRHSPSLDRLIPLLTQVANLRYSSDGAYAAMHSNVNTIETCGETALR